MVEFLLDCGADVNMRDGSGYTALHLATMAGHVDRAGVQGSRYRGEVKVQAVPISYRRI